MSVTPSVEPSVPPAGSATDRRGWTAGRIVSLVIGCILGLISLGLLSAGGWATWATNTQRDSAGYLTADSHTVATAGYVITSNELGELHGQAWGGALGTVRVRATGTSSTADVFIGIARKAAVNGYLAGVNRTVVTGWFPLATSEVASAGAAPRTAPIDARFWTAQASGPGTQTLTWRPESGDWTLVVMRPNGGAGVSVTADVGANVPDLAWFAVGFCVVGLLLLGAAIVLIAVPVARARKSTNRRELPQSPGNPATAAASTDREEGDPS